MATATVLEPVRSSAPPPNSDEVRYEMIDGQWVEMPLMSAYASLIAFQLTSALNQFALPRVGRAAVEVLIHLAIPEDRNRRPDGIFVSYKTWPKDVAVPETDNAWSVTPDLIIEVVSPSDFAEEVLEKIDEYFRAGVKTIWVVYPRLRLVHIYESWSQIKVLTYSDTLDGGEVAPGFRFPLPELFQAPAPSS